MENMKEGDEAKQHSESITNNNKQPSQNHDVSGDKDHHVETVHTIHVQDKFETENNTNSTNNNNKENNFLLNWVNPTFYPSTIFERDTNWWTPIHFCPISCLQFHGNTLVSGSVDKVIKIWDITNITCPNTLFGHDGPIRCLKFEGNVEVYHQKKNSKNENSNSNSNNVGSSTTGHNSVQGISKNSGGEKKGKMMGCLGILLSQELMILESKYGSYRLGFVKRL